MDGEYQIVFVEKPAESAWRIIGEGISNFNEQKAGNDKAQRVCYVVQTPDKKIVGGVIGVLYWDWLYVDLMWIKEELRGQGFGQQLLTQVEKEAKKRGATKAYLDTFSFQAPGFYKKLGYRVFGELKDFPMGHERYFLTKQL
jgi:ribosomal protein S18 acetylase RimI-like enzyme